MGEVLQGSTIRIKLVASLAYWDLYYPISYIFKFFSLKNYCLINNEFICGAAAPLRSKQTYLKIKLLGQNSCIHKRSARGTPQIIIFREAAKMVCLVVCPLKQRWEITPISLFCCCLLSCCCPNKTTKTFMDIKMPMNSEGVGLGGEVKNIFTFNNFHLLMSSLAGGPSKNNHLYTS